MAVAFVKNHTVASNKTAGTTLALTLDTSVPAGGFIVCRMVFDNAATAGKPLIASIGVAAGEAATWAFTANSASTSTTAGSFASGAMMFIRTTVAWPAGSYTVTLDTSTVQKAGFFQEFSGVEYIPRSLAAGAYSTTTTAASATTTGIAPVSGDLVIGFIFGSNAATNQAGDNDTLDGSWSAVTGVGSTGGNVATNNWGVGQYKIVTGTSHQTLNNSAAMTAGNGAIVHCIRQYVPPAITQASYRLYADGTETGSTALAAQDTAYAADVTAGDVNLQIRTRLQITNAFPTGATDDWQLQWEKTPATGSLADSYPASNAEGAGSALYATAPSWAQSFLANGGTLTRAGFFLSKVGAPNGTVTAALYAHTGTFGTTGLPTGSPLTTSTTTITSTSVGTTAAWYYFDFDGTVTLTNATPYCIAVTTTNTQTTTADSLRAARNTSAPAHAGTGTTFSGGSWSNQFLDLVFEVYAKAVTTGNVAYPVIDSYQGSINSQTLNGTTRTVLAQSFMGNGGKLGGARFFFGRSLSPAPIAELSAALYAHTGTFGSTGVPSGAPLATSVTVLGESTVSTTGDWYHFSFDGTFTLAAGTPYFIGLRSTNTGTGFITLYRTDGGSHSGNYAEFLVGTSSWAAVASDLFFEVQSPATTIAPYASTNTTDAAATTNRLGAGTGSFVAGKVSEDGLVDNLGWTANNYTEVLYSATLKSADLTDGDTLRFKVLRNGAATEMTYTQVPTITVVKTAPAVTQAAYRWYDDGTETAAAALAAQDTAASGDVTTADGIGQLRVRLQSTTAAPLPATDDWQLQWEKNTSGTWANVAPPYRLLVEQDNPGLGATVSIGAAGGNTAVSQSFTGTGDVMTRVGFKLERNTTSAHDITVALYAHSGAYGTGSIPTGAALATSTTALNAATIPVGAGELGETWFYFDFAGFTLVNGTFYCIVISVPSGPNADTVGVITASTSTHSGNRAVRSNAGTWSAPGTGADHLFRVYSTTSPVPTTVLAYASANLTDGAATSNRLGAGSGSFVAGKISETGLVTDVGWSGNNYTELLYSLDIVNADVVNGDTLRFRVLRNGVTTAMTYTQVPTLNVVKTAAAGGKVKYYNGSAFVEKPVKVWNGSAWVEKPLKVYNGSAWVLA